MGYPRMESKKQVELIPSLIGAMKEKPQEHIDRQVISSVSGMIYKIFFFYLTSAFLKLCFGN